MDTICRAHPRRARRRRRGPRAAVRQSPQRRVRWPTSKLLLSGAPRRVQLSSSISVDTGTKPWAVLVLDGPVAHRSAELPSSTGVQQAAALPPLRCRPHPQAIECGPLAPTVTQPGALLAAHGRRWLHRRRLRNARFELDLTLWLPAMSDSRPSERRGARTSGRWRCATPVARRRRQRPSSWTGLKACACGLRARRPRPRRVSVTARRQGAVEPFHWRDHPFPPPRTTHRRRSPYASSSPRSAGGMAPTRSVVRSLSVLGSR